jgi:hypothetical protein
MHRAAIAEARSSADSWLIESQAVIMVALFDESAELPLVASVCQAN